MNYVEKQKRNKLNGNIKELKRCKVLFLHCRLKLWRHALQYLYMCVCVLTGLAAHFALDTYSVCLVSLL